MDTRIQLRLQAVARRLRSVRLGWTLSSIWLLAAIIGLALVWFRAEVSGNPTWPQMWVGITVACGALAWIWNRRRWREPQQVAQHVEAYFPSLNESLLTAVSLRADERGQFGYLQRDVISGAVRHDVIYRWSSVVSPWRMSFAWLSNLPTLLLLIGVGIMLWQTPPSRQLVAALASSKSERSTVPKVQPGDTEVERGSSLIVTARFDGKLPDEVWLVRTAAVNGRAESTTAAGAPLARIAMRQSLKDPVFAAYLYDLQDPSLYSIEYDGQQTQNYRVDVFDYPQLVRADALLTYPGYTDLDPKTVVDTRRVTVAVGTRLRWQLHLNKPVTSARLLADVPDKSLELTPQEGQPQIVEATCSIDETVNWELELVDASGRTNQTTIKLRAKALPNRETVIRLTAGGDALVSPLEEFDVTANIKDDFAVRSAGIAYQFGGEPVVEVESQLSQTKRDFQLSELIDFEALQAEPNHLLSYYVWAEDLDSDGNPRRTWSDMFFVEVRPFEEIFREGQSQPQSDQQSSQQPESEQTEKLLELQKQIMAGTWNVLRQGARDGRLPGKSAPDILLLAESQNQALGLLEEKAAEAAVPDAEQIVAAIEDSMQRAAEQLTAVAQSLSKEGLSQALIHEQSAFQQLLRLQSREHEVSRSQRSSSSSQSRRSRARQQQLDQLELDNQENRYEQERVAQEQQNQAQSELRQVISRLRELAARQEDLNEQLRELEAALQTAESPEEQQQLQAQLERLREQQQQLLQDSDELQERMESQSNESMQQAAEQLAQTRESLQKSSEALRQSQPSQALSAGTRAEQELKQLQDEVRQQAANQFADTMQNMRQQAAELAQRQEDIIDQLDGRSNPEEPASLRPTDEGPSAEQRLSEQQQQLERLLEDMQQTVVDSEDAEPLLAQKLYDSYRKTQQLKAEERLEVTEQLLRRNLGEQARQLAGQSLEDLDGLREDIDRAAEAVLGSEVDSLRLALNQLDTLSRQLDQEVASATGQPMPDRPNAESNPGLPPGAEGDNSEPNNNEAERPRSSASQPNTDDPASAASPSERGERDATAQEPRPGEGNQPASDEQPASAAAERQADRSQEAERAQKSEGAQTSNNPGPSNQPAESQQASASPSPSQSQSGSRASQPGLRQSSANRSENSLPTAGNRNPSGGNVAGGNPITGDEFRQWSDRLRDVEELVTDPELRWEATQIRQSARQIRGEFKRHAADPKWSEVEDLVARPLRDLQRKVSEELIRRAAKRTEIVPIDRDPVPAEFSRSVRQYYENLGSARAGSRAE